MSASRLIGALLAAALLAACNTFGAACTKPREYTNSESIPPLQVPAGLEAPDTRAALRIPELETPERPRAASEPCLDEPPLFTTPRAPAAIPAPAAPPTPPVEPAPEASPPPPAG